MTTTITVGLPVYNAMPFLPQTINSLLTQVDNDFSLLIIDDGSSDGSGEYLVSLNDPRIRLTRRENRGLTVTLNEMLENCTTPWLIRHDADDIAYSNKVAVLRDAISQNEDAGMIFTNARYYQDHGSFGQFKTTRAEADTLRNITEQGYLLSICHPTVALNVKHVVDLGGYRFNLHIEDIDLWWRMALKYKIIHVDDFTVGFRLNRDSLSSSNLRTQTVNALYVQYLLLSELHRRPPKPIEDVRGALNIMLRESDLNFREYVRQSNICLGEKDIKRALEFAVKAFCTSPSSFLRRAAYEMSLKSEVARAGVNPLEFKRYARELW